MQSCCLQNQTVYFMKLKQKMLMNIFMKTNFFDLSDYQWDSKSFDPFNKKVIAKMKEEFKEKIISEFIGLKSKTYSLVDVDDKMVKWLIKMW